MKILFQKLLGHLIAQTLLTLAVPPHELFLPSFSTSRYVKMESDRRCLQPNHSMKVKVVQSCPTLCNPMTYKLLGILQARILEWLAFPFSREPSQPRDQTQVSHIAGGVYQLGHRGYKRIGINSSVHVL